MQPAKDETTEFKNDKVHVTALFKPACEVELRVKASPSLVQSARREAIKAVSKEISIPGFRRGKAPEEMIQKKFSRDVERKLHDRLADAAFVEAQKLANIPVLNHHSTVTYDLQKMGPEGSELLFRFETDPKIPSVDRQLFQPKPVHRAEVGDKQVDEAIQQMRFFFADWTPVLDRPIQEKDYLIVDIDTIDGEVSERVFNQVRFEVSSERMAEWMRKIVLGAKMGDVVEGISEPDADATEQEKLEFRPKKVRVKIFKVEEAALPELDDVFAKRVGSSDVAQMRQSIFERLSNQAALQARDQLREQVNEFLIAQYPFELPRSLVQTEKDHRQSQLFKNEEFKRDWDGLSAEERKKFEDRLFDESLQSLRLFYLSRKIIHDAQISVTHQEIQDEAIATLNARDKSHQISVDQIPREVFALAMSKVMLAKAQNFIIGDE